MTASTSYHSNPFRLREDRYTAFEEQRGPHERFDRFVAPWDVVNGLGVGAGYERRLPNRRRLGVRSSVKYRYYTQNRSSDRAAVELGLYTRGRRGGLYAADLEWAPRVFKGNYRLPDDPARTFAASHYSAYAATLTHEREVASAWAVSLEAGAASRTYEEPFRSRSRTTVHAGLGVGRDVSGSASLSGSLAAGRAWAPVDEGAPASERSFLFWESEAGLRLKDGPWRIQNRGRLQLRSHDAVHLDAQPVAERRDLRWSVDAKGSRRLDGRMSVWLKGAYASRTSERTEDEVVSIVPVSGFSATAGIDIKL